MLVETLRIIDLKVCADRLIERAFAGGGPDNVTVIVADARDTERAAPIVRAAVDGASRARW